MLNFDSLRQQKHYNCAVCGCECVTIACHAKYCAKCREIVKLRQQYESAVRRKPHQKITMRKLELSREERVIGGVRPTDSESHHAYCPNVTVCDAYHNGQPMRSRSAVL